MGLLLFYYCWFFFYRSVRVLRYYQTISCTLIFAAGLNYRSANVSERRKPTLTPPSSATLFSDASLRRLSFTPAEIPAPTWRESPRVLGPGV